MARLSYFSSRKHTEEFTTQIMSGPILPWIKDDERCSSIEPHREYDCMMKP